MKSSARVLRVLPILLMLVVAQGCCVPGGHPSGKPDPVLRYAANPRDVIEKLSTQSAKKRTAALNPAATRPAGTGDAADVLLLSGGGSNGAWGAGFLVGWGESGKRPVFDVVTGISTGALIATGAFLGDDDMLREAYTTTTDAMVQRHRWWVELPFANSARDTAPLRTLLKRYVSDRRIDAVAKAAEVDHDRGLYVGSVDLNRGQLIIWDLIKIARDGQYDLYRDVVQASASAPVFFPPVRIGDHLHVDGGVRASLFLRSYLIPATSATTRRGLLHPHIYAINNGSLDPNPAGCVRDHLLPIGLRSLQCLMDANGINSVYEASRLTVPKRFHLTYIPGDQQITSFVFDQQKMTALFEAALRDGRQPKWKDLPDPDRLPPEGFAAY